MAKKWMIIPILFGISFTFGQIGTLLFPSARVSVLDVCTACMGVWLLVRSLVFRQHRTSTRLWVWIMLFILSSLISAFFSKNSIQNLLYIARWCTYALLYQFIMIEQREHLPFWQMTLYWSGVVMAIVGLFQLLWYPYLRNLSYLGWDPHLNRVFSTLFDPNFMGLIYLLTIILGISLSKTGQVTSWWGKAGIVVTLIALFFTYSRSSFVASAAAVIVWLIVRRKYAVGVGILIIFFSVLVLLPKGGEGQNLLRTVSTSARIGSMAIGWDRFRQSPIVGMGFVLQPVSSNVSVAVSRTEGVDTSLLYVAAATGMLGFVVYLGLWWHVVQLAYRAMKKHASNIVLLTTVVAIFVHSIFTNSLLYPWVMAWVWILAGTTEKELTADR